MLGILLKKSGKSKYLIPLITIILSLLLIGILIFALKA